MILFQTEYSLWWLFICLPLAVFYAYLLYAKKNTWSKLTNQLLFLLRTILVSLLLFLLLGPFLKITTHLFEKPTLVVAIDDSASIAFVNDEKRLKKVLEKLQEAIDFWREKGYLVKIYSQKLKKEVSALDSLSFDGQQTNLSETLKLIAAQQENKNFAGIILLTDGIYNQGISPLYVPLTHKVHAIGIGDTLPKNDISLKALVTNKIAYLDNKFVIAAEIASTGLKGKQTLVNLLQNGTVLQTQTLVFQKDNDWQKLEFIVEAKQKGIQRYTVQIQPLSGEFTKDNNTKSTYVEILDAKEKILLVAAFPHPDLKALKAAIEKNKNYEVDLLIPDLENTAKKKKKEEKYDLVIFHQIPNKLNVGNEYLLEWIQKKTATFFILATRSDLIRFNQVNTVLTISPSYQTDKVFGFYNQRFNRFSYSPDFQALFQQFPPLVVPFADVKLAANSEVILWQKVGSVVTQKPLLAVGEQNGVKSAVLLAEGIWQWRLQNYAQQQNFDAIDELLGKLMQYLSMKEDKRKFRVYSIADQYLEGESVQLETEVYNDVYEKIYGQKIDLQLIKDNKTTKNFSYVNSFAGFRYIINGLDEGIYRFKATTLLNGSLEASIGEFTIERSTLESIQTVADFNLLRQLTAQNGGLFVKSDELDQLKEAIAAQKPADIIHSQEQNKTLLHLKWLFIVFVLLVSVEWTMRKLKGSY